MPPPQRYRLLAFDVDGTLIRSRDGRVVWQLLNERFGGPTTDQGALFRAFLGGHISYREWVDLDISGWWLAGARREQLVQVIREQLAPVAGAPAVLRQLRQQGYLLAVVSGTLDLTLQVHFDGQPFHRVFTNRIWFDQRGRIDGWRATPYDMEGKAEALRRLCHELELPLSQAVFVGDNTNDIPVMQIAGLPVAFEPKDPSVARAASATLEGDLSGLVRLLR